MVAKQIGLVGMLMALSACGAPPAVRSSAPAGLSAWGKPRAHPVAWLPPEAPAATGIYAPNQKLSGMERLAQIGLNGPETIDLGPDGFIYTGYASGEIMRLLPDGTEPVLVANTGGRPLGLHSLKSGGLIVADAERGLLQVDLDGTIKVLAASYQGEPFTLVDDAAIAPGEDVIYFTEASSKFSLANYTTDILEHGSHGRLFRYDRRSGAVELLHCGINFANGLIVAPDGDSLLIDESGSYRVLRYWLHGAKAGTTEVFADDLPGFPDNITFNGKDRIWVALARPRDAFLDRVGGPLPLLRRLVSRLPDELIDAVAPRVSQAVALDLNGQVTAYLRDEGQDAYAPVTTVLETPDWLYFGSLTETAIGRLPRARSL